MFNSLNPEIGSRNKSRPPLTPAQKQAWNKFMQGKNGKENLKTLFSQFKQNGGEINFEDLEAEITLANQSAKRFVQRKFGDQSNSDGLDYQDAHTGNMFPGMIVEGKLQGLASGLNTQSGAYPTGTGPNNYVYRVPADVSETFYDEFKGLPYYLDKNDRQVFFPHDVWHSDHRFKSTAEQYSAKKKP